VTSLSIVAGLSPCDQQLFASCRRRRRPPLSTSTSVVGHRHCLHRVQLPAAIQSRTVPRHPTALGVSENENLLNSKNKSGVLLSLFYHFRSFSII